MYTSLIRFTISLTYIQNLILFITRSPAQIMDYKSNFSTHHQTSATLTMPASGSSTRLTSWEPRVGGLLRWWPRAAHQRTHLHAQGEREMSSRKKEKEMKKIELTGWEWVTLRENLKYVTQHL
jgi:hypothetical protein